MKRKFKPIKGITKLSSKVSKPYNIFSFDVETTGSKNIFYMGSVYGIFDKRRGAEAKVFYDRDEMARFIVTCNLFYRRAYLVAHNLEFDFMAIFRETPLINEMKMIYNGSSMITSCFENPHRIKNKRKGDKIYKRKDRARIKFVDLANYFGKVPLKKLAKIVSSEKFDQPSCLGKIPNNEEEKKTLEIYNIQDSRVTYDLMNFFQDETLSLGGMLKLTIGSSAVTLFRKQYLNGNYKQPPKEILNSQYKCYYGGRTEVFIRGVIEKDLYYYDVNSLYPSAMLREFPNINTIKIVSKSEYSIDLINNYMGFSCVEVTTPKGLKIPLLPFKDEKTLKLLFPSGTFTGYYTHEELKKAIELGYTINKIHYQQIFTKSIKLFDKFVTDLYNKRLDFKSQGNPAQTVIKLFMNNLYGKLAQKIDGQQDILNLNNAKDHKKLLKVIGNTKRFKVSEMSNDFSVVTDTDKKFFGGFINPILAAYVTSYARLTLYKYFEIIHSKGGEVYYCDTDSVFTNVKLEDNLNLGEMKLEDKTTKSLFVKPKMYAYEINDKFYRKLKGVKLQDEMKVMKNFILTTVPFNNIEDYKKIVTSDGIQNQRFIKFKTAERSKPNGKYGKMVPNQVIKLFKKVDLEDTKRVWEGEFDFSEQKSSPIKLNETYINENELLKYTMVNLKEQAKDYVPTQTKNIAELKLVSVNLDVLTKESERDNGEKFKYKYIVVDDEEYRVPNPVLGQLKALLEDNPKLEQFKVTKSGEGVKTIYTTIPK